MGLSFTRPYLLILIPLLIALTIYSGKWLVRIPRNKKRCILILRTIILSLIILSICDTSLYWKVDTTTTIFLIDGSDSTLTNRNNMENFINEAVKNKGPKDQIGVISFGENAQVESFVSKEILFSKVEGKINGNYTDIENAITTALSIFPDNSNKRIVLISDGEENSGTVSKITSSLGKQDIDFKYYKVEKNIGEEVAVENISVPQRLTLDEEFNLVVTINSTTAQSANINLFNGRSKVSEQKVQLQKGINKFMFKDKADSGGFRSYKVMVEPSTDSEIKNNEATTFTSVVAKPRVLVIKDNKGEAEELIKMLKASSIDYTLIDAAAAPRTLQEMTSYKSIITCNVSADNLNEGFLNSIESYVKDFGGGLIATGGDNSFALGGYAKTPLEKVLPVYMDMRGKKEIPKMAMVLIIDKSGSMTEGIAGISKVDMAKEAAIRSLESLRQGKDELGVLAFDGAYSWAVKEQVINDIKAIEADIGTIRADGGTSIIPALQEGYNALKKSDAKLKHIILLTDGQAEKTGYDSLIKDINKDNITVSTVAVGKDADKQLLETIAQQCGGRSYLTDEYTNIPRIFSKETFMASRSYLNNREFTPIISSENNILSGVAEAGLPSLLGYIGATQKETAREILKSDEDDPILTVWQYGLGKTAAWNSDISGKWSANYLNWNKNLKLWQNLLNFTFENYDNENVSMEVTAQGNKATVVLKDKKNENQLDSSIVIVAPSGVSTEEKLSETAPGEYTGTIDLKETGVYMINGKEVKNGEILNSVNTGYAVQYSPEYKINISSTNLDKLITYIGGKNIKAPNEVFGNELIHKKGQRNITIFLLSLALILFMFDIALRRLNISMYKLKSMLKKVNSTTSVLTSSLAKTKLNKTPSNRGKIKVSTYEAPENEIVEEEVPATVATTTLETAASSTINSLDTSQLLKNKRFK
ncbi:MAG: VWA domain-containing protein [Clostridiaceae bacterium]|nr:VWA domain-containing protein [Clostridiaceae bacterium]